MISSFPETTWPVPDLPKSSIHIWSVSLDLAVGECDWDILESSERKRARRFRSVIDRDRFVVGRSALKRILGTYLDVAPERLRFEYGRHGKPSVKGLHFNVSHAEGKSLIAVNRAGPVGIDLEPEKRVLDVDGLAQIVCSKSERARISGLPFADRRMALLRICVGKEAFLKMTGEGFSRSLSQLEMAELPVGFIDAVPGFVSALALLSRKRA
jgi:4'-phosphopantetheinyl transferase